MIPTRTLQLHSTVHEDSTVTLALVEANLPAPGPDDVVVRMEAAPINPSDLGRRVKKLALLSSRNVPRQPWPLTSLIS